METMATSGRWFSLASSRLDVDNWNKDYLSHLFTFTLVQFTQEMPNFLQSSSIWLAIPRRTVTTREMLPGVNVIKSQGSSHVMNCTCRQQAGGDELGNRLAITCRVCVLLQNTFKCVSTHAPHRSRRQLFKRAKIWWRHLLEQGNIVKTATSVPKTNMFSTVL